MGTYEILERSSEESFRDIVEVKTPSPLRSSESSESNKSLLNGIDELLDRKRSRDSDDKLVRPSAKRDFSKFVTFRDKSAKEQSGNSSTSIERSSSSSPSSLKQRIRDFPNSSANLKFSDRLAALDRRIRRERDAYLQLLGSGDRIDEKDEKDEGEAANALDEIVMIATDSRNEVHGGSMMRSRGGASFSAPETTRLEAESCAQRSATGSDNFASGRLKKFEESRPPKFLRPIEPPAREIIRSNAPPLCLTDGKIVQLLRRGSASAREESSRKSKSARVSGKMAAYGKPTGLIIENLSSGSEGDGCNEVSEGIGKFGGSVVTITKCDETKPGEITNGMAAPGPREKITDLPISQKIGNRSIGDTDLPDDPESSRSDKKTERTKNHVGRLTNCQDNRSSLVPRLHIKSQDYSRGSLVPSRGDSTKRSLDVDQLMRALSDVSIQQQIDRQIAWADQHFPIATSGSRSEQKNEDRPSRLGRSNDSIASRNERTLNKEFCARKSSISRSNDYVDVPEESSQPLRTGDAWRIRSPDPKKSFGSFEALEKNRPKKPRRNTLKGQLSEPVTSRDRCDVRIITEYSSRRDRTPPIAKRSEESEKPTKTSNTREENRDRGSDRASRANFHIYEDSPTGNENLSNRTNQLSPDGTSGKKNRSARENDERRRNRKHWKNPASRNLFWADNSSELSRRMASGSSGSPSGDFEKDSYDSGSGSCLVSPGVSLQALSKLSSSGRTTDASRCSSKDSPGGASKKNFGPGEPLASGSIDKDNETATLTKGLPCEGIPGRVETVDSPRRLFGKKMEKSESALDARHRGFESSQRGKVSSSLSRLEASPSDSRGNSSNLGARKKSQERSPFTITGGKSSAPVVRAKRNGKSETTYRLGFEPSRVRLVNGEVEFPTTSFEVNQVFPVNPDVPGVVKQRRVVPKIRKFVGKLSRWRRWKSIEERPDVEETTRVLYENKACRTGAPSSASPSESAAPMRTTERLCSNRDGLWVVGFSDEAEETEKQSPKKSLQDLYEDNEKLEFNAPREIFDEDDKNYQDTGNGCFCAKFCLFLIGGDSHRYTFPEVRSGLPQYS